MIFIVKFWMKIYFENLFQENLQWNFLARSRKYNIHYCSKSHWAILHMLRIWLLYSNIFFPIQNKYFMKWTLVNTFSARLLTCYNIELNEVNSTAKLSKSYQLNKKIYFTKNHPKNSGHHVYYNFWYDPTESVSKFNFLKKTKKMRPFFEFCNPMK